MSNLFAPGGTQPKPPPALAQTPEIPDAPHPILQRAGFDWGGIHEFNKRVENVVTAYHAAHGTMPPPGLALDVVRSSVPPEQYGNLFHPAYGDARASRALGIVRQARAQGYDFQTSAQDKLLAELKQAVDAGTYAQFAHDNVTQLHDLASDPKYAGRVAKIIQAGPSGAPKVGITSNPAPVTDALGLNQKDKEWLDAHAATFGTPIGFLAKAVGQIAGALIHAPGGLYATGHAVEQDVADASNGDYSFKRTRTIANQIVASTKNDLEHPYQNPGYALLDVLGMASAGAGTAARLARAGRAAAAGDVAGVAKGLVTKPTGGTVAIGRPGAEEHVLVSDNPLVASFQRAILNTRQAALEKRLTGDAPAGLVTSLLPEGVRNFLGENLSFETKVGREADARRRIENTAAMTLARELDHVTGGVIAQSRAFARMPSAIRSSLSRGEQKAIQVLSFGVKPEDQIAFHEMLRDAGIGDPSAHLRQIADLRLAAKVLNSKNPSDQFVKAAQLARQAAEETQRRKIEDLGLSPLTAGERVAKPAAAMGKEALTQEYPATGAVEPFYTKLEPRSKAKGIPSDRAGFYANRAGKFGVPLPQDLPELTHAFTGSAITAGDFRIDATALTSEAYARTVRAATVLAEHKRLWDAATDTPHSTYDVPIRDSRTIPEKLREAAATLTEGTLSKKEADDLPADMQDLIRELYPDKDKVLQTPIEGVKWIDSRMLGSANELPSKAGTFAKVVTTLNEPLRDAILFLRPAYALNLLGNAAMILFDEGFMAIPNIARALNAERTFGEEATRTIDALTGSGRSKSYSSAIAPKLGQKLAGAWSVITDRVFRRAAFIHYARKLGYDTPEKMRDLLKGESKDLAEATRRANKSMVEFDNLTAFEKNTLRHIIFVYPWMRGSLVWSIRSVMEHPIKTDVLTHLGAQEEESDPIFQHVPAWFKQTGYFPVGWNHDGTPRLVNPTSINTFTTLGDLTNLVGAGVGTTQYNSFSDLFGPAASALVHGATGIDQFGNRYPDHQWIRAAEEALLQLPQISAFQRNAKKNPALKPIDVTNRDSVKARLDSALKRTVLSPGWMDGYGTLIAGGFSPRSEDPEAAAARYWRDVAKTNPKLAHRHELTLLNEALRIQGEYLGKPVSAKVKQAVRAGAELSYLYGQQAKAYGRTLTSTERAKLLLDYVEQKNLATPAALERIRRDLKGMVDGNAIDRLRSSVFGKYLGGNELTQWDENVRMLASFKPELFEAKAADLFRAGITDQRTYAVTPAKLHAYGLKYLSYLEEKRKLAADVKAGKSSRDQLVVFQDEHNVPVNGLPSYAALDWAYTTPKERQRQLHAAVNRNWSQLSSFEKNLLGVKTNPNLSNAWAAMRKAVRDFQAVPGNPNVVAKQRLAIAKQIDKQPGYNGFLRDYTLATLPKLERFEYTTVYKQMPPDAKTTFDQVASVAKHVLALIKQAKENTDTHAAAVYRDEWRQIVKEKIMPWLSAYPDNAPARQYLAALGGARFLDSLIAS